MAVVQGIKSMLNHPYLSSEAAFNRLFLLISAIANNPNIGSNPNSDPMLEILTAMQQIDPQCPQWSVHTLRKDIRFLIDRGVLPKVPNASKNKRGYQIGSSPQPLPPAPKRSSGKRRSHLSDDEIKRLHGDGMSYSKIAELAGISKARIGQIITDRH
jgi:hypothetical protein